MNAIVQGEGFPVVFLHGWGGSTDSFAFVAASLKRSYRTVRPDLPGFGASPPPENAWGAEAYADALIASLKDIGIDRSVFVGHSFGGRVGIVLAAKYPDAVAALVLVDSAGIRPKLTLKKKRAIARYKRAKARGEELPEAGSADYRALAPAMRGTFVRLVNEDLSEYLPAIATPTLIVWGDRDEETPLWMAKRLSRGIRDSATVVLPGGHYSYLDAPYTFIRVLDAFLSSAVAAQKGGIS